MSRFLCIEVFCCEVKFLIGRIHELWEVFNQNPSNNGERDGKVGWKNWCMFFLTQDDDVTSFNEVKQRLPEAFHESIKSSTMTEADFTSIMGELMSGAPAEADLSGDITGMKDEMSKYLSKKGWEHCARLVHYEPDNPNYIP
jgi:hypothetical protein